MLKFSENDFYTAWLEKIEKIKEACYPFDFRKNIEFWCERIVEDYAFEKEEIKHYFLKFDLVSLKILKEILEGHDQQYEIIFNNCTDFSGFLNAIDFLEHLPYKLKRIMISIIENQKECAKMKNWKQVYLTDDAETLTDGKVFIKVVWGWATKGSGQYNEFGTNTTVSVWTGDVGEFAPDIPEHDERWERVGGFNHNCDDDESYFEGFKKFLKEIKRRYADDAI